MAEQQVAIPVPEGVVQVAIQERVVEVACSLQKAEEGRSVHAVEGVEEPCPLTCAVRAHVLQQHPRHLVVLLRNAVE